MKYLQFSIVICVALFWNQYLVAQNDFSSSDFNFTYGAATKFTIEFSPQGAVAYKLSVTGGIGYDIDNAVLPTFHAGVLLFNSNSIGANQKLDWYTVQAHVFVSTMLTVRLDKRDFSPFQRNLPLYHFADFTANPLQNPYKSSLSYGCIFVENQESQRVGFFNANVMGRGQLSYYNDGGPVLGWAGDNRDRYYTGGLTVSYHGDFTDLIDLVELSYHKYTGYQKTVQQVC